jgi:hypothetical protein
MFQIGFRSLRYTLLACVLICSIGYGAVIFFNPFGSDRFAFLNAFILLLPSAIASVMMCWVLMGTHVQAFVRSGGAILSISVGIMVTTVLFGITTFVFFPAVLQQDVLFLSVIIGIIAAFFFFAVREVFATIVVVAVCSVFTMADRINPSYVQNAVPYVWISAVLAVIVLMSIHWYLSRNYVTIRIPEK